MTRHLPHASKPSKLKALARPVALAALLAGIGCGLSAPAWAAYTPPAKPLSIEDIARYDALDSFAISPDGKHIAALVAAEGQKWPVISIWDTSDLSKTPVWIPSQTQRITGVGFFTTNKIMFVTEQPITGNDGRPTFINKLYYADLDGRNIAEPFKITGTLNKDVRDALDRGVSANVFNDNLYDPSKVLMETVNPDDFVQKIFELDLTTGRTRTVALGSNDSNFLSQGVDLSTGEPMIKEQIDTVGSEFWYKVSIKDKTTGAWVYHEPLSYMLKERRDINILGYDTDPSKLIVASNTKSNYAAVYEYDIATKTFSAEPIFANDKYDITGVVYNHDRQANKSTIEGIRIGGPRILTAYLDPAWAAVQKSMEAAFPGKNVSLIIAEDTRDSAVVMVEAPDMPPSYFLYKDAKVVGLGDSHPWIDASTLGKPEFVTFKARDGLDIPAFITLPPGWTPEQGPVPTVVLPHGGPWARDYATWDDSGWPQFLATRGIAVIQPQYRGSDGWGLKLWLAGDNEWGQKMQDDKDDAAAYMVSRGVADPNRLAIFGYSYGGFAAIAATVRPGGPYKCAIAGAGVSSLDRIGNLWGGNHLQRDIQGRTVTGLDPMKNVDKASIPLLMYHGDHDRQADTDHSRMFFRAMKAAGKDVEYHEIKGMWHTLPWRPEWHRESLGYIEAYLKSPKCGLIQ